MKVNMQLCEIRRRLQTPVFIPLPSNEDIRAILEHLLPNTVKDMTVLNWTDFMELTKGLASLLN